jgi:hypothetical protein
MKKAMDTICLLNTATIRMGKNTGKNINRETEYISLNWFPSLFEMPPPGTTE